MQAQQSLSLEIKHNNNNNNNQLTPKKVANQFKVDWVGTQ